MSQPRTGLFDELAVVGKAFASAKRLEIIELLAQSPHSVEEISRATGQGMSTVSAHLQILRASRLVRTHREGTRVIYRLAGEDVAVLFARLGVTARTHSPDVEAALDAYLGSGGEDVQEVSREELLARLRTGEVTLLDVRPPEEFRAGHIPGALSMPLGDLAEHLSELPAGDLVAYCRGAYCVLAHDAVTLLHTQGRPARRLEDGMLEWRLARLPIEQGA
ncbi:MAG TPA: metalloregulator ArsR/SmtB family transcription factor [Segeticoccus sp.]|uniref:ArsR/SmtB family transcription factor n=1 Tax=Segeticoccus sp. TaxID=2706531 RepID=UPI002D7EBE9A|nr:metalloregulator ArsR/SmtB family transcription factor [Segeticoccus sp.]HET8601814.1 metalloregulator ArsR/SmtB family transcription factor [Segeticoccus sp.]